MKIAAPFLLNTEVVLNSGTKFERFDVMQMQQVKKRGTLIVN
jgi:hypothetical protein